MRSTIPVATSANIWKGVARRSRIQTPAGVRTRGRSSRERRLAPDHVAPSGSARPVQPPAPSFRGGGAPGEAWPRPPRAPGRSRFGQSELGFLPRVEPNPPISECRRRSGNGVLETPSGLGLRGPVACRSPRAGVAPRGGEKEGATGKAARPRRRARGREPTGWRKALAAGRSEGPTALRRRPPTGTWSFPSSSRCLAGDAFSHSSRACAKRRCRLWGYYCGE